MIKRALKLKKNAISLIIAVLFFSPVFLLAQDDLINIQQQLVEDFIESIDDEVDFDFNTIFEDLQFYFEHPINLNKADAESLRDLRILNEIEITQILNHRLEFGDFISIYELQTIPSLDLRKIPLLKQCISVKESEYDFYTPLSEMLQGGRNTLYLKWAKVLEEQDGYIPDADGNTDYVGDNNRFYLRYRYNYLNRLTFGITAEKDAGEDFFQRTNKNGFDFYSAHAHLKDYNRIIKDIVIGDYSISLGQGLLLHNSFGTGKSSLVMNVKKSGRTVRAYSSVSEFNFLRGAAATFRLSPKIETSVYISRKRIDGNIRDLIDTVGTDEEQLFSFSSFGLSGLHRTENELENRRGILNQSAGATFKYRHRRLSLGANVVYDHFDKALIPADRLYNLFDFNGQSLLNTSVDYGYRVNNFTAFGEVARSENGAFAQLHGLLIAIDRNIDASLLYRKYDKDYQNIQANSFGESTGTQNEEGIYLGLAIRPHSNIRINGYADVWRHEWLRFRQNAPSSGNEYFLKVEYFQKRNFSAYVQLRIEEKDQNDRLSDNSFRTLNRTKLTKLRFHFAKRINSKFELRNRIELSDYKDNQDHFTGFLIYQDLLYRPSGSKLSVTARYAIFDVENFLSRIYTFENDLLFEYFIPAFQNRGRRFYVNMKYNWNYNLSTEFRFEQTYYDNIDQVSAGNELSLGNTRSRIKAQIKYQF